MGDTLKEVRKALLDADVDFKTAKNFIKTVKEQALGREVLTSIQPGQLLIKITHEELTKLMGEAAAPIELKGKPATILLAGLQGAGKTTHAGKLAARIAKSGRKPLLIACDVHRPAAVDQLHVVGESVGADVYSEPGVIDAVLAQRGMEKAKAEGYGAVIVDTAGRLAIDEVLLEEIAAARDAVQPDEILFVGRHDRSGRRANRESFQRPIELQWRHLDQADGDARGGAAQHILRGWKAHQICRNRRENGRARRLPPRANGRSILGKGDVVSLVERAQQAIDEQEAKRIEAKLRKNTFDLDDFYAQIQQIKKMGNVKDLLGMVPGMGKALKGIDVDDNAFMSIESIIQSMTPAERSQPGIINGSRRTRIAKGCGRSVEEVNRLLKQFEDMKKVMGMMAKGGGMPRIPGMRMPGRSR